MHGLVKAVSASRMRFILALAFYTTGGSAATNGIEPLLLWTDSTIAVRVFLACLALLAVHSKLDPSPKERLLSRIFVLGLCLSSLAFHLTSQFVVFVSVALLVWLPLPILRWRLDVKRRAGPAPQRRQGLFDRKPAAVACMPCR